MNIKLNSDTKSQIVPALNGREIRKLKRNLKRAKTELWDITMDIMQLDCAISKALYEFESIALGLTVGDPTEAREKALNLCEEHSYKQIEQFDLQQDIVGIATALASNYEEELKYKYLSLEIKNSRAI